MITTDPKIIAIAFLSGVVPALLWLWFWLREDTRKAEPKGLITMVFIVGMLTVLLVLPLQRLTQTFLFPHNFELICFAAIEELMKLIMVLLVVFNTDQIDEPTDWPIYLMTLAVGFAGLENTLFLLKPFALGQTAVGLMTSELRFLGSTLLHSVASGTIGVAMGLSYFSGNLKKFFYIIIGIIASIALHSAYNFFIMKDEGSNFLQVFSFLWVGAILIMLIFEKLRRMNLLVNNN